MRLGSPEGVEAHSEESASCSSDPGKSKQGCCSVLDAADARRVAAMLGVPFYVLNFQQDFCAGDRLFRGEYNRGRTPNPCVRCNDWLKFGRLAQYAQAVGRRLLRLRPLCPHRRRSSHRRAFPASRPRSSQGSELRPVRHDAGRLWITRCCPSADIEKHEVRAIAEEMKLPVYNKPDSQEICFVPDQDYAALVRRRTPGCRAARRTRRHRWSNRRPTCGAPAFHHRPAQGRRRRIRPADLCRPHRSRRQPGYPCRSPNAAPQRAGCHGGELAQRAASHGAEPIGCSAKIRYNHDPQPAGVIVGDKEMTVRFAEPQSAITPGQAVVLYDGDVLLGGGWIDRAID